MDDQGLPQVTNAELIADLEAILLELGDRLDNYLDLGAADLIAADEGFNFAGQLQVDEARTTVPFAGAFLPRTQGDRNHRHAASGTDRWALVIHV